MQRVRDINIAVWFYLFASDFLNPAGTDGKFWIAKASQAVHLNRYFDDPVPLLGNGLVVLGLLVGPRLDPARPAMVHSLATIN